MDEFDEKRVAAPGGLDLKAAKIVSAEVIGLNTKNILVNGKLYVVAPPTIRKMCGAVYYLSEIGDGATMKDMLMAVGRSDRLAHALSWFIQGDDSLADELTDGTVEEIVDGLQTAFDMIGAENFIRLSVLTRSAEMLTARQR